MPTEHEFKYVLKPTEKALEEIRAIHTRKLLIEQGYLVFSKGNSARVRCVIEKGDCHWFFTFKQKAGGRVIELEQKIDCRDGQDLWAQCLGRVIKKRFVVEDKKGRKWEIDFFLDKADRIYFAMAEIELPEGKKRPKNLPDFIEDNLVYAVPLTDDRFSNKRLGDVNYATELYKSLTGAKR